MLLLASKLKYHNINRLLQKASREIMTVIQEVNKFLERNCNEYK